MYISSLLLTQSFGNFSIVHVGLNFTNLPPLHLRPHHEGIHRAFDVIWVVLFGLKQKRGERWPINSRNFCCCSKGYGNMAN